MTLFDGPCQCNCGAPAPCECDKRFPLNREYERLVREGATDASARFSLRERIRKNHLKQCPQCDRWMLANNLTVRTICDDCKETRKAAIDERRNRQRTRTGADASRKRTEREVQDRKIPKAPRLNRAINKLMKGHGRNPITADHCHTALADPRYRRTLLAFLNAHAPEMEKDLRAYLTAQPRGLPK